MASQQAPVPQQTFNPVDIPVTNPGAIIPVYANHATLFNGPHDIRIVFSEIVLEGPKAPPKNELRASVALSYTQANQLLQALTQSLNMAKTAQVAAPAKVH